jgi:co-chaperonin GroES (HSP10)
MKPVLDRVLLRKIEEEQEGPVVIPDQFKESDKYQVIAIGDFVILGGMRIPLWEIVDVGDVVLVGQYNVESCVIDGEKFYISRVQDVKARQRVAVRERAAVAVPH